LLVSLFLLSALHHDGTKEICLLPDSKDLGCWGNMLTAKKPLK